MLRPFRAGGAAWTPAPPPAPPHTSRIEARLTEVAKIRHSEVNGLIGTQAIQEVFDANKIRINPLSVAIDVKRNWKAVMAQVAEKQSMQAALSFRWKLSIPEKNLRAKGPAGSMLSPRNLQYGGVQSVAEICAQEFNGQARTAEDTRNGNETSW
ncbi:hypothetical protein GCK32_012384 [Trichostrongylus colubriformis]|uniref:Uncharacterized protein n=1 Tax=Trichostrongylus colubriformis TaxID=6319 RepID=A0AAN8F459_TRICO